MKTNCLNYIVDSRILWEATGKDTLRFLQGMCTADLRRALDAVQSQSAVAATCAGYFLNLKGKVLSPATFAVFSDTRILFSLPTSASENCLSALTRLIVADDVELRPLPNWGCYQVLTTGGLPPLASKQEISHRVPGAQDRCFYVTALPQSQGFRLPRTTLDAEHEEWWAGEAPTGQILESHEYLERRIARGIPEWNRDFNAESFLLEFPIQDTISFHKGCYLGQEVVARTTYRGHVTRAFCQFESEQNLAEDFLYEASNPDKPIGKITSAADGRGLGLIRVQALEAQSALIQKTSDGASRHLRVTRALIPYEK